jgi:hypothetical protein
LRTVPLGPANKGVCGPAISANPRPRGPTFIANEPTLFCEGLANTPVDQHAVRTRERLEHQRLVNLCVPLIRSLQGKRSFCLVVYPRQSSFKSVGMSPRQCGLTFVLDIWDLWALFAMPGGPAHCLQANWLRVLGTAELPHIDQGVRHQFHAKMSLLKVFKPKEEPLEFILPRKGPIHTRP